MYLLQIMAAVKSIQSTAYWYIYEHMNPHVSVIKICQILQMTNSLTFQCNLLSVKTREQSVPRYVTL